MHERLIINRNTKRHENKIQIIIVCAVLNAAMCGGTRQRRNRRQQREKHGLGTVGIVEFPWSKMLKYEEADLPESKIDYNGHEVTVRANVAVSADTCINDKRLIKLSIFLKPDNTDGFSPVRKDSINERATYNTVVLHNRLFGKEGKYTLKGEADVYARSFSPTQCTAADKARLTYTARVDVANPSASTIKYKLVEAEWKKADPVIPTPSNQGYRYSGIYCF